MAKNKIEVEDIEDDVEENDDEKELDASVEEEKEDSEEKEESEQGDSSEDNSEEEESEGVKVKDEDREAIRERRRREKKMKRERERRERVMLQNTIVAMADEIKKLKDGQGEVGKKFEGFTKAQIDGEISELGKIYNQAQAAMESAIADGDGKRFTQAKAISDKAWARYTFLEAQKRQRPEATSDDKHLENVRRNSSEEQSKKQDDASGEGVSLGKEGRRFAVAFTNRHKSWYDPNGGNRDSKVVLAIDTDLYNEGYDPESKEYWEELEDRCKDYIPHRFKNSESKSKPKSIVGGSGNDYSTTSSEKSLPKEFVQTLKAAGYWDDAVKRKAAIKNYYANKKGA